MEDGETKVQVSDFRVEGCQLAENLAVGCAAQHAVTCVISNLPLPVPDWSFGSMRPAKPLVTGAAQEQVVELRNGAPDLAMVIAFTPLSEALFGSEQEPGSGLIEERAHVSEFKLQIPISDFRFSGLTLINTQSLLTKRPNAEKLKNKPQMNADARRLLA
jgi:hypothetical protein